MKTALGERTFRRQRRRISDAIITFWLCTLLAGTNGQPICFKTNAVSATADTLCNILNAVRLNLTTDVIFPHNTIIHRLYVWPAFPG